MSYNYCNATEIAARLPYMLPMTGEWVAAESIKSQLQPITKILASDSLIIDAAWMVQERGVSLQCRRFGNGLRIRRVV